MPSHFWKKNSVFHHSNTVYVSEASILQYLAIKGSFLPTLLECHHFNPDTKDSTILDVALMPHLFLLLNQLSTLIHCHQTLQKNFPMENMGMNQRKSSF